jgi:Fic family protein
VYERIDADKAKIDAVRPFEGDLPARLQQYYRIGLTWSSNALEGNTLTITETKVILEDGLTVGGHPLREIYEVTGHGDAYDYMFTLIKSREITIESVKTMHRLFYKSIDEENAGIWRKKAIFVTGTDFVFPKWQDLPEEMQRIETWAAENREEVHPVDFAALLHLKFVTAHPFVDGNGRVARLLMNLALIQDGYMLAIIPPIARLEYINAIKRAQLEGDTLPFREFIAERVCETQLEVMRLLHV